MLQHAWVERGVGLRGVQMHYFNAAGRRTGLVRLSPRSIWACRSISVNTRLGRHIPLFFNILYRDIEIFLFVYIYNLIPVKT